MSWFVEMPKLCRFLISDYGASPDNSDNDIISTIVVAAQLTQRDVNFEQEYRIDVDAETIDPDPTTHGVLGKPKDDAFINLVCMRAACIIAKGDAKRASGCAMIVSDGLSRIDTGNKAKLLIQISKTVCDEYTQAVFEYEMGQNEPGAAIIGPYSDGNFWGGSFPEPRFRDRTFL